ncbi:MAG TPA: T9SS type A sorting domain-containing protein [Bacteroidales bacterium]|nr:T9SS type A sorting domain-containing protein [Bacteroidales bacterium]HPS15897.1 T9SS type A sorting domain-containing protein [Bacteroidales bacterium]
MRKSVLFFIAVFISLGLNAQYWSQQNTNMTGATYVGVDQVSVVDSNIVWVNGMNGAGGAFIKAHARTNDGGATWEAGTYNGFDTYTKACVLAASDYNNAFCVAIDTAASTASFWQTTDGGANWTMPAILNGGSTFADGVYFWDSNKGFAYGDPVSSEFDIYTTTNGGASWDDVPGANIPDAASSSEYGYDGSNCGCVVPGGIGFFLTNAGNIYKTIDYGATWSKTPAKPFTAIASSGVVYASSENYIIVGSYNSTSQGWEWQYTTDGGTTWALCAAASGAFYEYQMCYVPGTTNTFVATSPFSSTIVGVGYSEDGGLNWTDFQDATYLQPGGSNIQCLGVDFYDITMGWVGNYDQAGSINSSILKYDNPNAGAGINTYSVNGNDFRVYPNPSNGQVYFAVNGPNNDNVVLNVYDVTGNLIFTITLNALNSSVYSYDFSGLSKGVYVAKISGKNTSVVHKLTIQ